MLILSLMTMMISILLAVAFFTLLERKFLSYTQNRKGPNKISFMGILQPITDAIKLLTKSQQNMESTNIMMLYSFPSLTLMISMVMFPMIPLSMYPLLDMQFSTMAFLVISSLMVYLIMMMGWSSNSKYSYLGTIRNTAQMISYEISFFLIMINIIMFSHSYNLFMLKTHQNMAWFIMGMTPLMFMWLISCMAEVNRTPFDFAEGESELVSGFNIEYSGGHFALIFLAEYASMILMAFLTSILFSPVLLTTIIYTTLFLWFRATLPRFRYDMLMNLNWKTFLPITLLMLILFVNISSM